MHIGIRSKSKSYDFPEEHYEPLPYQRRRYRQRVKDGYANMRQLSVVVCAITRNTEDVLDRTIYQVETLLACFKTAAVVIFENDSTDNTPALLKAWASEDRRVIHLQDSYSDPVHQAIRSLKRAERMAHYRNVVKAHVAKQFSHCDYALVLDTDLVVGFSRDGVAHTFGHKSGWDMMGSNGVVWEPFEGEPLHPVQYDAWAYRAAGDWKPMVNHAVNRLVFRRGDPLVPLFSCFGGLGVYRMPAYLSASYNGSDCEHVPLHRTMRYNGFGRLFLNPSMICDYGAR